MNKKLKKIIINTPYKLLIGIIIISVIVIYLEKIPHDFSFINNFESEIIVNFVSNVKDYRIIFQKLEPLFWILFITDLTILIYKSILKKESIKIMKINTFENTKINIDTKYMYENDEFFKDLSSNMKLLEGDYEKYKGIVEELDKCVENFMEKKEEKYYAFAGILHTPFILRLGYKIGDQTYFKLFHKKRSDSTFKLLDANETYIGNYPVLKVEKNLSDSDILIVSISTTFPITREQLQNFDINHNNYIKFETDKKGFDVITSEKQIDHYKEIIFNNIRDIVMERNIKLIHLCISSSVAFTFALGQGFSKNYDPKVVIYNYENQEYKWGLKLFEKSEDSIVVLPNVLEEKVKR